MTVIVPLTQGYEAIIDDEDAERVLARKWHFFATGNPGYGARSQKVAGKVKTILLHRFIILPDSGLTVDHIDGNGLNNCRNNLRACTIAQNVRNRRTVRNGGIPYKGVYLLPSGSYVSTIMACHKKYHLGTFSKIDDAARAYDLAAQDLFGEFAHLNFPGDVRSLEQRLAKDVAQISEAGLLPPDMPSLPRDFV